MAGMGWRWGYPGSKCLLLSPDPHSPAPKSVLASMAEGLSCCSWVCTGGLAKVLPPPPTLVLHLVQRGEWMKTRPQGSPGSGPPGWGSCVEPAE